MAAGFFDLFVRGMARENLTLMTKLKIFKGLVVYVVHCDGFLKGIGIIKNVIICMTS